MITKIEKTAKQLKKETKGNIDLLSFVKYAERIGYRVVFFNTPDGDDTVSFYDLADEISQVPSFTIAEPERMIFIDGLENINNQMLLILHELGHILLGHIGDGDIDLKDKDFLEVEADTFAYAVISEKKMPYKKIAVAIISALLIFSAGAATNYFYIQTTDNSNNVIITRSGQAYHREGCMSINNKDYIYIPQAEAEKIYASCGICNP